MAKRKGADASSTLRRQYRELMDQAPEGVFLCIVPQRCGQMELDMTSLMHERFTDMEALLLKELAVRAVQPVKIT